MKKIILFACVTMGLSAQAQYFNHDYGSPQLEEPQSGMNTTLNHQGFLISGLSTNTTTTAVGTIVGYVDKTGNIPGGSTFFVKGYRVKTPAPTNIGMNSRDGRVLELSSNNFGIAGTAHITSGSTTYDYIYYIETDTAGAIVGNPVLYDATGYISYKLNNMTLSTSTGNALYLTGYAIVGGSNEERMFVLKINFNGTLIWSHTYDIDLTAASADVAYDILEDNANSKLLVVGKTNYHGSDDGVLMTLNPTNGAALSYDLYGTTSSSDYFSAIIKSNDASSGNGYVLAGGTNATSGNTDGWMVRLANNLSTTWSKTYDYNGSGVTNYFSDLVERVDSMGNYRIYAGGSTVSGLGGSADMEVDKVTSAGTSISQFTYGDANGESLVSIDANSTGSVLGLSMFGYRSVGWLGSFDLTIYKSYFNGVTQCDWYIDSITAVNGPVHLISYTADTVNRFASHSTTATVGAAQNKTNCSGNTVAGGNNKMLDIALNQAEVHIYNAESANNYTIIISKATAFSTVITVRDMYGRVLYSRNEALQEGENRIPLDLNDLGLSSGIYIISATQGKTVQSKKVSVIR